jgi:hypothetical protein
LGQVKSQTIALPGKPKSTRRYDYTGEPIPEQDRHLFGGETNFSRVIGIYDDRLDCNGHSGRLCEDNRHFPVFWPAM